MPLFTAVQRIWRIKDSQGAPRVGGVPRCVALPLSLQGLLPASAMAHTRQSRPHIRQSYVVYKTVKAHIRQSKGIYKTVKAKFWLWLSGNSLENLVRSSLFARRGAPRVRCVSRGVALPILLQGLFLYVLYSLNSGEQRQIVASSLAARGGARGSARRSWCSPLRRGTPTPSRCKVCFLIL